MSRSGAAGATLPKCKLFEQLSFMHDNVSNRHTVSNVTNSEESQSEADLFTPPPSSMPETSRQILSAGSTSDEGKPTKRLRQQKQNSEWRRRLVVIALVLCAGDQGSIPLDGDSTWASECYHSPGLTQAM
ncbi:uncharacterized protein LOC130641582 [Hydractinia symbiolongicarpus]|uniref:uncharacterized protein LOC130641582 n=1 Tax=Hydractinia symbiolongicarpus TaxID=13093 RepID=UPI00254F52D6|nr:uncharacterized protein LOC130641582 [Hydractinia symbiolongicarpus]